MRAVRSGARQLLKHNLRRASPHFRCVSTFRSPDQPRMVHPRFHSTESNESASVNFEQTESDYEHQEGSRFLTLDETVFLINVKMLDQ